MHNFALLAEFLGTFLLITTVYASGGNPAAIGGILAVIVFLIGEISGAHVNPAITFSLLIAKKIDLTEFLGYVGVQLLGGAAAYFAYKAVSKN